MKREDISKEAEISPDMLRMCKQAIARHPNFEEFLISVWARKVTDGNPAIVEFPNEDMHKYEEKFTKKYCKTINDAFVFDKLARRTRYNPDIKRDEPTGYFSPFLFWAWVNRQKI